MLRSAVVFGTVVLAFVSAAQVVAKGPVDAIEVSGTGLPHPLRVVEGSALLEFNPWGQQFLGEESASTAPLTDALIVTMQMTDKAGESRPVYEFSYFPGTPPGVIYIPGPGDAQYDLNKTTIMSQNDGKWFMASPGWEAFVASFGQIRPPVTGSGGLR